MRLSANKKRIAERLILLQAIIEGFYPIIIHYGVGKMPALLFAGLTSAVAAAGLFILMFVLGKMKELTNGKAWKILLIVSLFNTVLAPLFIFEGARFTSGVNTAILLQAELPFTFLIYALFFKEHLGRAKLTSGLLILAGTLLVLFNGNLKLNVGDLLIILGTLSYPFGNFFAKKALAEVSPVVALFVRNLIGAPILFLLSLAIKESWVQGISAAHDYNDLIVINGLLILVVAKMLWYTGLKNLHVTRAIPIVLTAPAFSLIYAIFLLNELPTFYQLLGITATLTGVYVLSTKKVEDGVAHSKG